MVELSENQKAFFRRMKESPELERHGFRLLLERKNFEDVFDVLKARGFFAAERNPAPEESEDVVSVPYWPALDYLRKCAEQSSRDNDIELAEKVMAIVREVSPRRQWNFSGQFTHCRCVCRDYWTASEICCSFR